MINSLRASLIGATAIILSFSCAAVEYRLPAKGSNLVGENQYYVVPEGKLTLEQIASEFQLGLTNLLEANPDVDPFLPKVGT
jgi:L,D-transpeptidase YbiS